MNQIQIRQAKPEDAEAIITLHHQAIHQTAAPFYSENVLDEWSPPVTPERVQQYQEKTLLFEDTIVAVMNNKVVGFGVFFAEQAQVKAVYVSPQAGRQGVGTRILKSLEKKALEVGIEQVFLDASINAEAFYSQHGYEVLERGTHTLARGTPMDCVKMSKELRP